MSDENPAETIRQQTLELEAIDAAIFELSNQIASDAAERGKLWTRMEELRSGKIELRRRRARHVLDLNQPPVTFYGIEYGPRVYEFFDEELYQRVLIARGEQQRAQKAA